MPDTLFNLCIASIPLWIPAVIGFYLIDNRRNDLSLMAGLLTLKPIITTPIWAGILFSLEGSGVDGGLMALYSILPGAGLTVLVFAIFRQLFSGRRSTLAWMLILLDCVRWINSCLMVATASLPYGDALAWACIFALVGLIFPTAYSVVALMTIRATSDD